MKLLLLGSGGREHALAWKISQSPACEQLYIAPGNGGTRSCGTNVAMSPLDFSSIGKFCREKNITLLVVGPEDPLVQGIHDYFLADPELRKIPVIGPQKTAARLEGSKDFSKSFMQRHNIPTAAYRTFTKHNLSEGPPFLESLKPPYVLKADGLAAGKGVLIIDHYAEACHELESMLKGKFGAASEKVVIEAFLKGIELSVFILTHGKEYCVLPVAKDYKRIGANDTGPNTGGMGSVSGVPFADQAFMKKVEESIILPTVHGLAEESIPYTGFIFFGLINVEGTPLVIEYNARMGDPETESVMPRLKTDLVELFDHALAGTLGQQKVAMDERFVTSIMMVSGGYPGEYAKGKEIFLATPSDQSILFHAGTSYDAENNRLLTSGGRVLSVTSYGNTIAEALKTSYDLAGRIQFENAYYRPDIGFDL